MPEKYVPFRYRKNSALNLGISICNDLICNRCAIIVRYQYTCAECERIFCGDCINSFTYQHCVKCSIPREMLRKITS